MAAIVQPEDRWKTIKDIWTDKNEQFVYQVLGGLFLVLVGVWIGAQLFANDLGYWTNGYTELLSIAVTVFVLNALARRREDQRESTRLKQHLIRQIGSDVRDVAVPAVDELRANGFLTDGSLQGAILKFANLQKADLWDANLQKAVLWDANLQEADLGSVSLQEAHLGNANLQKAFLRGANLQEAFLWGANLQEADLGSANLQEAHLVRANLQKADLTGANLQMAALGSANLQEAHLVRANLQRADLTRANLQMALIQSANLHKANLWEVNLQEAALWDVNLQGTDLTGANLQGAYLTRVNPTGTLSYNQFDEQSILPDKTRYNPELVPEVQLNRFIYPNHPDFWRPEPGSVWWWPQEDENNE